MQHIYLYAYMDSLQKSYNINLILATSSQVAQLEGSQKARQEQT